MLDLLLLGRKTAPDFFWDARSGALPPGATFTRGSAGWSFNGARTLTQAGTNVARFDFDPATLTPLGYLAEMQSTNGLLQSGDLANAVWVASGVTITGNSAAAPDGTVSMAKLVESAANVAHKVSQAITLATATTAGFSWFVRAGSRSKFFVSLQASATNYATAVFDTASTATTASETSVGAASGAIIRSGIRNCGGGLYRVWMQANVAGANPTVAFGLASLAVGNTFSATGDVIYAGDGASFAYGWGAQFDTAGIGVTSYIPTAAATVTRSADLLSLPLTSLPGWNANRGGVLAATYRLHTIKAGSIEQDPAYIWDGGSNIVEMRAQSGTQAGLNAVGGLTRSTTVQVNIGITTTPVPTAFLRRRQSFGWSTSRAQLALDGIMWGTQSGIFNLPVGMTALYPGGNTGNSLNGTVESLAYYAGARGDAFVQGLTQ